MFTRNKIGRLIGILLIIILPLGSTSIVRANSTDGSSPSDSWAVDLGDLDGDGDLDAFVGNQDSVNGTGPEGFNEVWLNNGDATFTYSSQQLGQEDTEAVKLADLDIDGDLDAFTANTTGPIIWINDGSGVFTEGPTLGSAYAYAVDIGDLDNDGDLDAFVGVMGSPDQVWLNQGGMTFTLEQEVGANEQARHVALGDLDSDSDLDVFVVNHFNQTNIVYLNDGSGHFVLGQTIPNNDAVDLSLGDIDNDGDIDAFVGNSSGEADDLYVNDGTGNFSLSSQIGDYNTEATALGDLDGDGDLDIYMGDGFGGANRIWFNNGDGTFFDSGQSLGNFDTFGTALGDLDGDSDLDIFDANKMAETVWLNDGAGTFSFGQFLGEPPPLPEPTLQVEINHDWVVGMNWPVNHLITLTINGEEIDSQVVFDGPWGTEVNFNSWDTGFEYDIQPGDVVTLEDTVTGKSKTHTALDIRMTKVSYTANTVEGLAAPGSELVVWADAPCDKDVWVTTDKVDGTWVAYFDCNLSEVEQHIHLEQYGIDNTTFTSFYRNPPKLQVDISQDWVYGWDWLPGTLVSLTIDDPDIPGPENYVDESIVGNDQTVAFDFPGVYFVEPGHIVTLTDGGVTEIYEVENLDVYVINPVTDIINGIAEPGKIIEVTVGSSGWISIPVETNEVSGEWEVDFTGIADLTSDSWGNVRSTTSWSENHTQIWWNAPIPTTYNINPWWSDATVRTEDDVFLNLGWGACTPQLVMLFQRTAHIDITINGEPLYPEGDEALFWNPIEPMELDGCKIAPESDKPSVSLWQYTLSPLEPGIYEVYVHYWLDHPVIDGVDGDGDGRMDIYDGTLVENTITIIVK